MTNVMWGQSYLYNPVTGDTEPQTGANLPGYLLFVPYGNYGGPDFSSGVLDGELLTKPSGKPLSFKKLEKIGDEHQAVDLLDYRFYLHDVASSQAGQGYTPKQAAADFALLTSVVKLDASYDPEASLYAGLTTFVMVGRLVAHGQLNLLPPAVLLSALEDAVNDVQYGVENLSQGELITALNLLFEPDPIQPLVFNFDFSITTSSPIEELYEFAALNTLNTALDFGESDEAPLDTGSQVPFLLIPGTSEYRLSYSLIEHDLDLLSI